MFSIDDSENKNNSSLEEQINKQTTTTNKRIGCYGEIISTKMVH